MFKGLRYHSPMAYLFWLSAALWFIFLLSHVFINRLFLPILPSEGASGDTSSGLLDPAGLSFPLGSVTALIPARDEEDAMKETLSRLSAQDGIGTFHIIVVDDQSKDATPQILRDHADPRLQVVSGANPPSGWLGKPHALSLGLKEVKDTWVFLMDADIHLEPTALKTFVTWAEAQNKDAVVFLPRLEAKGFWEYTLMWLLGQIAALFPIALTNCARFRRISMGAGAGLLVRRNFLVEVMGGMECVANEVVDDIVLGLRLKAAGARMGVAAASEFSSVRMYRGFSAVVDGFSKNAFPSLQNSWSFLLGATFLLVLDGILPWVGLVLFPFYPALRPAIIATFVLHLVTQGFAVQWAKVPFWVTFTSLPRSLVWIYIQWRSAWITSRKGVVWRGRTYDVP